MDAQIAQKIHASTNPRIVSDRRQNRAKDVFDILMLRRLGQFVPNAVHLAAEALFLSRAEHAWPPNLPDYPAGWRATIVQLAIDYGYPAQDPDSLLAEHSAILAEEQPFE